MTAEDYINALSEERKVAIQSLQKMIKANFSKIIETMDYRMPTYILKGETLCAIASQKNYMALYIMPYDLLDTYQEELKGYNCGKSCIRFKKLQSEDLRLFKKIVKDIGKNYPKSKFYGKMRPK